MMPGARPSLWRESHGDAWYNHDANTRIGNDKVPIEVKFDLKLSGWYSDQDVVQVAVMGGLRAIIIGQPSSKGLKQVRLSDECRAFLTERQRPKKHQSPQKQRDAAALQALINGVVSPTAHPCEIEVKETLQLHWRREIAQFCIDTQLGPETIRRKLADALLETANNPSGWPKGL